jgi:hypothetical protein
MRPFFFDDEAAAAGSDPQASPAASSDIAELAELLDRTRTQAEDLGAVGSLLAPVRTARTPRIRVRVSNRPRPPKHALEGCFAKVR